MVELGGAVRGREKNVVAGVERVVGELGVGRKRDEDREVRLSGGDETAIERDRLAVEPGSVVPTGLCTVRESE